MHLKVTATNVTTGKEQSMIVTAINRNLAVAFFKIHNGHHFQNFQISPLV